MLAACTAGGDGCAKKPPDLRLYTSVMYVNASAAVGERPNMSAPPFLPEGRRSRGWSSERKVVECVGCSISQMVMPSTRAGVRAGWGRGRGRGRGYLLSVISYRYLYTQPASIPPRFDPLGMSLHHYISLAVVGSCQLNY